MKKGIIFWTLSFLMSFLGFSQKDSADGRYNILYNELFNNKDSFPVPYQKLYNNIERNVSVFFIRTTGLLDQYDINGGVMSSETPPVMDDWLLPVGGWRRVFTIEPLALQYPDKEFYLFRVSIDSRTMVSKNNRMDLISTGPKLYDGKVFLVACTKNGYCLFISGLFYRSAIANDFSLDIKNPETFYYYLSLRGYANGVEEIRFSKRTRKYLIFEGICKKYECQVRIKVLKKDFDNTHFYYYKK